MLQEELKNKVAMKKFLLVLDDVWYDEKVGGPINVDRWRELFAPLLYGAKGTKILVTTIMYIVARTLGCVDPFSLDGLESEDSWELFRRCAFSTRDPEDHMELKSIGECILQRLNGSALAIKVIGGHLSSNFNNEEWNRVLKSGLSNEKDIMTILRLSYECLPGHLQRCFAFCSLFPKGHYFEPDLLVNMWIAHEFVQDHRSTYGSLRNSGRSYFDELLSRSFFQALQFGDEVCYVMHDLMNDLAAHISNGECYRVEVDELEGISSAVRHLSIPAERVDLLRVCKLQRLRTLIILNKCSFLCSEVFLEADVFKEFKSLRLLDLSGCCLKLLPNFVDHMIHLRCLTLQRTLHPLPDSLCRLHHLQVLSILSHPCFVVRGHAIFPKQLGNLSNILCIDVDREYSVDLAALGHVPCLRVAGEFRVEKTKVQGLAVLKDMNELRERLVIRSLENVKSKDEATDAQLVSKSQISNLALNWGFSNAASRSDKEYDVLDALRPHPGLMELIIEGYPGCISPSWLESEWLSRLEQISIYDCTCWKLLPPLGQLPSLRELRIARMNALECIGPAFYGVAGFPSLETLELTELPELAEWSSVDYAFPTLCDVSISRCPKLKELPPIFPPPVRMKVRFSTEVCTQHTDHHLDIRLTQEVSLTSLRDLTPTLPSLEGLCISGCSDFYRSFVRLTEMEFANCTSLPDFECFPALQNLIIKNCPELKELPQNGNLTTLTELLIEDCYALVSLRSLRDLSFLSKMEIKNCMKLTALPQMFNFFSLRVLIIQNCPELVSLPEDGLSMTLNFLYLNGCHPLLEEQFDFKHGAEWEKYAVLPSCFYADKWTEDVGEIATEVLIENDLVEASIQSALVHPTDSAASSSSFV